MLYGYIDEVNNGYYRLMGNKSRENAMSPIQFEEVTEEKLRELNVDSWSSWGCDVSTFDWEYSDDEQAYVLEGRVIVKTDVGDVEVKKGDLVTFPRGMQCTWQVLEPIRKVYRFF